jgi:hypothetical protein
MHGHGYYITVPTTRPRVPDRRTDDAAPNPRWCIAVSCYSCVAWRALQAVENILNILIINYKIMKGWLATANGSYQVPLHPTNYPLGMYYIYVPLFINKDRDFHLHCLLHYCSQVQALFPITITTRYQCSTAGQRPGAVAGERVHRRSC